MSLQKVGTIVSSSVAFILVTIKLVIGIMSGSIAVLSSAIDSMLDLCVSIFNFIAVKNSEKPIDERFNYGRGKIEALASLFEGLIITASGLYIFYESIYRLVTKNQITYIGSSITVMIISVILTAGLVLFLDYVARKTNNLVIRSDSLHYKTDLFSSGGVLISLWIISYTGFFAIDSLIGICIAIYIIVSAYDLIKKGFLLLLDVSLDDTYVQAIKNIIESTSEVNGYHFLRTRESGHIKFVDMHLVFNTQMNLLQAHSISDRIENQIKKLDSKSQWIFNIHLDPYDDSHNE